MGIVHGRPEVRRTGNQPESERSRLGAGRVMPFSGAHACRRAPPETRANGSGRDLQSRRRNQNRSHKNTRSSKSGPRAPWTIPIVKALLEIRLNNANGHPT